MSASITACERPSQHASCREDAAADSAACAVEDAAGLPEAGNFEAGPIPTMPVGSGGDGGGDGGAQSDAGALDDAGDPALDGSVGPPPDDAGTGMNDSASSRTDADFVRDAVIQPRD